MVIRWLQVGYSRLLVLFPRKYEKNSWRRKMTTSWWNSAKLLHNVIPTNIVLHRKFLIDRIIFRHIAVKSVFQA